MNNGEILSSRVTELKDDEKLENILNFPTDFKGSRQTMIICVQNNVFEQTFTNNN